MDAKGKTHLCAPAEPGGDPVWSCPSSSAQLSYLIVIRGGIPGTMLRLAQKASSLGRSVENTFQLFDSTVSRHHAVISIDPDGAAWVTDLGSTNGTFVSGKRLPIHTPVMIEDGSRLQVGSLILLKYLELDSCEEGFQREIFERIVRDDLTGLYNRGYFLNQIGPLAELNSMRQRGLAIMLVDLDHFKRINDTRGHEVGDRVLREVAVALRDSTRSEDLVARYGGEEFILALPCCSREQAIERAERIREQLAGLTVEAEGGPVAMTASLGISFTPLGRVQEIGALISAADNALYEAKRSGRNRVVASCRAPEECNARTESADAFVLVH
jgi:diguanylate cyclase (GGDEF)-like protein